MILLSDFKPLKAREIKLKPIRFKIEESIKDGVQSESVESVSEIDTFLAKKAQLEQELSDLNNDFVTLQQEIIQKREQADKEIELNKQNWEKEKVKQKEQAINEGYQAGYEEGRQNALIDFQSRIEKANEIIHQAEQEREIIIDKSHNDIVDLSMYIAKKVVMDAIMSKDAMLPIVNRSIKAYHDQTIIRIRVSVDDFDLIHSNTDELTRVLQAGVMLSVLPDEKLAAGGCIIETPTGQLDVSVDRQLEKIHEALTETMEEMQREN